ncbi:MAG: AsmA-like C-terminal region-containing protein [Myxococcota bacterium]|jgi:hypothetical protein|nr:AsmA-like C-terminal region-containing protein [Myxococcota bacterium]
MRRFLAGLFLLLIVLGVGLAVAVSNLDSYLNENKGWVEEQIEAALVRPVSFDEAGLSFRSGLGVRVAGFRIGEDADYGEGDFFSVGQASVRVAIWPALFGRIEVTRIALHDVSVVVINDVFGMNTDTLGGAPTGAEAAPPPVPAAEEEGSAAIEFTVALAEIRSGKLRYIDRTSDPETEVEIDRLEFTTTDVGLARPLNFRLTGELLGEEEKRSNLEIEGSFGPLPRLANVPTPLDVRFSIDPIRVEGLRQLPGIRDALDPNLPIAGTMRLSGRASGQLESPSFELDLDATDALLSWSEEGRKDRGVPFGLAFDVGMVERDVEIRSADLTFAGVAAHLAGKVTNLDDPTVDLALEVFDGRIDLDGGWTADGNLALDTKLEGIDLGVMTRSLASEGVQVVDGRLNMSLALSGQGTTVDELLEVVEGAGRASIEGGVLHDINLVEEALVGFTGVPGLSSKLPDKLAKKYPALFNTGNTEFETMEADVEVRDGKIHIDGIQVDVADFALSGDGSLSLVGEIKLGTVLELSESISDALIDEAKPLKHLRGDGGRIEVPIKIKGTLPELSAKPDADVIARKLGAGAAENLAEKAIDKVLDKVREKKLGKKLGKAFGKLTKKGKKKKKKNKKKKSTAGSSAEELPTDVDEDGRELLESLLE